MSFTVPALFTHPATAGEWGLVLFLNIGAVYRLSRLVARDHLLDKPRNYIESNFHGSLVVLVTCMWCLSFWFGLVAVFFTAWDPTRPWWLALSAVLTMSAVAGLLGEVA
jgi:hypothetical protein